MRSDELLINKLEMKSIARGETVHPSGNFHSALRIALCVSRCESRANGLKPKSMMKASKPTPHISIALS
eukprot:7373039-Prymnesium_polylepis.1